MIYYNIVCIFFDTYLEKGKFATDTHRRTQTEGEGNPSSIY